MRTMTREVYLPRGRRVRTTQDTKWQYRCELEVRTSEGTTKTCNACFTTLQHLRRHQNTTQGHHPHGTDDPKCITECGKRVSRRDNVAQHERRCAMCKVKKGTLRTTIAHPSSTNTDGSDNTSLSESIARSRKNKAPKIPTLQPPALAHSPPSSSPSNNPHPTSQKRRMDEESLLPDTAHRTVRLPPYAISSTQKTSDERPSKRARGTSGDSLIDQSRRPARRSTPIVLTSSSRISTGVPTPEQTHPRLPPSPIRYPTPNDASLNGGVLLDDAVQHADLGHFFTERDLAQSIDPRLLFEPYCPTLPSTTQSLPSPRSHHGPPFLQSLYDVSPSAAAPLQPHPLVDPMRIPLLWQDWRLYTDDAAQTFPIPTRSPGSPSYLFQPTVRENVHSRSPPLLGQNVGHALDSCSDETEYYY